MGYFASLIGVTAVSLAVILIAAFIAVAVIVCRLRKRGNDSRGRKSAPVRRDGERPVQGSGLRDTRLERLCEAKLTAETAAADVVYAKLFSRLAEPLQLLLGLAESGTKEPVFSKILERRIRTPIREAIADYSITFNESGLSVPVKKTTVDEKFLADAQNWSERDMEDAVSSYLRQAESASGYQLPKRAVMEAGKQLRILVQTPCGTIDCRQLEAMAKEITGILVKNGIYPMFRGDERLSQRPDLRGLFVEVHNEAVTMPGLFTKSSGKLVMYGHFQGTCHREEGRSE